MHAKNRKIVVLGYRGVGKTSLVTRHVTGHFPDVYSPTIENTHLTTVETDKLNAYNLQVVDTAGQDELSLLPSIYAVNVDAYVLVYSVQSMVSFQIVQSIYQRLIAASGLLVGRFPVVLVATKVDLKPAPRPRVDLPSWLIDSQSDNENSSRPVTPDTAVNEFVPRVVSCEAGRSLAAQWQAAYVETSALDNINVAKVFELVADRLKEADDGRFLMSTTGLNEKPSWSRRKSKVAIPKRTRPKKKPALESWWRKLTCTSSSAVSESNM